MKSPSARKRLEETIGQCDTVLSGLTGKPAVDALGTKASLVTMLIQLEKDAEQDKLKDRIRHLEGELKSVLTRLQTGNPLSDSELVLAHYEAEKRENQ